MSCIDAFLANTLWHDAERTPLAGDASKRRYERVLSEKAGPAILMIAPLEQGEETSPFIHVAKHLSEHGFSAPRILVSDETKGLLLLEDLGDDLFASLINRDGEQELALYEAAVDLLVGLHRKPLPSGLRRFDSDMLTEAISVAPVWYAQFGNGDAPPALLKAFAATLDQIPDLTEVMILRDFHAENLIWLPKRSGVARVGLLDFQDALIGHRAYDLMSLLQDARRDVPTALSERMVARYIERTGVGEKQFRLAFATLGVQRNLRILGIFARLSLADGKTRYIDFIPRVWAHIMHALSHPDLGILRDAVLNHIPAPDPDHLARIRHS